MNKELQSLIENIYSIIDTYYDDKQAVEIAVLIERYTSDARKSEESASLSPPRQPE